MGEYYECIEVEPYKPSTEVLLAQLDTQYESDKTELQKYYMQAMIEDDTKSMTDIKAELTALAEKYDSDIKELEAE